MIFLDKQPEHRAALPDRALPALPALPGRLRLWLRDLCIGLRLGAFGGREGWIRNALTAVGVGIGVALLLLAASVPQIMDNRDLRVTARTATGFAHMEPVERSDTSVVMADVSTEYRTDVVSGSLLRADGDRPSLPPGIDRIPAPGEMLVSPALAELLRSPDGGMLKERLGYRVTGVIGKAGLLDPGEYLFYAGTSTLTAENGGQRTEGFGGPGFEYGPVDPVLTALATLICVVLLVPVAVFIATAVRVGGERRDRRLAALRLVGADIPTTRRIAAGEALFGAVLGLAVGAAVFAVARLFAGSVRLWGLSAFPSDVVPLPGLGALILLAVPVAAVVVTLFALRSVVIEPLGVVRSAAPRRRRLWWRLLLPAAGVALLLVSDEIAGATDPELVYPVPLAGGAILVLIGVTALFPWVVDAVCGRLRGGPVSWQLAMRGLQLRSDTVTRAVSGIMVAVAGAIALQMVFAGMHDDFRETTGRSPAWGRVVVTAGYPSPEVAARMLREFGDTEGAIETVAMIQTSARTPGARWTAEGDPPPSTTLTVAGCPVLERLARLASCEDGDVFVVHGREYRASREWVDRTARKGKELIVGDPGPVPGESAHGADGLRWTLPEDSPTVWARKDVAGWEHDGVFATPGAIDADRLRHGSTTALVRADESMPDAHEHIRNTASRIDPALQIWTMRMIERDQKYTSMQTGLLAGASGTMVLIAASMLVSQIEQLRERRRLLSVLLAFGTRRSTLAWSLLWQTVLPVVLGTAVAVASGLVLGAVMLRLIGKEMTGWGLFLPVAATGPGVILLVTLVSLPSLWRMMRPDGLRTE
ncbi:FtsX-like permease family protein [Streptomyces jumonjinensis]|uniref:FtsX-like permease family protein n=1 Tax=Streptomyces jumonjinensis TaxID=1945 RepID=UPI002B1FD171|nr:FtsX-like permease family protein [Streptomyces jumonjinensis]